MTRRSKAELTPIDSRIDDHGRNVPRPIKRSVERTCPASHRLLVESEIRSWRRPAGSVILFFYFAGCVILLIRLAGSLWLTRLMKQTTVPVIGSGLDRSARSLAECGCTYGDASL